LRKIKNVLTMSITFNYLSLKSFLIFQIKNNCENKCEKPIKKLIPSQYLFRLMGVFKNTKIMMINK